MAAIKIITVLFVVIAAVSAQFGGYGGGYDGGYGGGAGFGGGSNEGGHGGHHVDYYHNPQYKFAYGVKDAHTHDIKHHNEHRDGDKTEGEYSLVEPDGTTRTVKYHVHGKSGFIATVHRSGHAVHPQPVKHYGGHNEAAGGYGSYGF